MVPTMGKDMKCECKIYRNGPGMGNGSIRDMVIIHVYKFSKCEFSQEENNGIRRASDANWDVW
jgi:hypothetical protein